MDVIIAILLVLAIIFSAVAFFTSKKKKKIKTNIQQPIALTPEQTQAEAKKNRLQTLTNRDYRQHIQDVAAGMNKNNETTKQEIKSTVAALALEQKLIGKDPANYKFTVDLLGSNAQEIYGVDSKGELTQTVEPNQKLNVEMFWEHQTSNLMLIGAASCFILLMIMVI